MRKTLPCVALLALASACSGGDGGGGGGTGSNVATSVTVAPGTVNLNAVGATQVVHATVRNQNGGVMSGASLSWSSSAASATVSSLGGDSAVVTAVSNGAATITASSGSASGQAAVTVAQAVNALQKAAGDAQTGAVGAALTTQVRVRAVDRLGAPVAGATVAFAVTQGGGSVNPASQATAADGFAATTWTLGTSVAATQEVTASAGGAATTFGATPVAGPPAHVVILGGDNQTGGTGSPVASPPSVRVTDGFNNPVVGLTVTFTVVAGGGSVTGGTQLTDATGMATVGSWTLGPNPGPNSLSVALGGVATTTFNATAVTSQPGTVGAFSGTNQAAMAGTGVSDLPSVRVVDTNGNPLAGVPVTFSVTSGGGNVSGANQTTNANGVATVGFWALGSVANPNQLKATVTAPGVSGGPVLFNAAGCEGGGGAGYAITLCFTTTMSPTQRAAFETAAAKWSGIITADLPDDEGAVDAGTCGATSPSMDMTYDDLLIFAAVEDIDGPGAVLGSAGPCYVRGGAGGLPIIGRMRFDVADVLNLEANSQLASVIIHEMGHVLGVGSMWSSFGLLKNASGATPLDTYFSGTNGIAGFDAIGGTTYTGGNKVPVENTGGAGTANSHWRESVLKNELMTGYINNGSNPLSILTVRSLQDLGYSVNPGAADAFSLTLSLRADRAGTSGGVQMVNDVYTGPLWAMGRHGRRTLIRR